MKITFDVHGGHGHDQDRRRGLRRARALQERHRRDDDAGRHRVLDGARRAGVRRQVAALPREEREARHRPRHQGPQRAAEHVRVRRLTRAGAVRVRAGRPRSCAQPMTASPRPRRRRAPAARRASARAGGAAGRALRARVGGAVGVEREPLRRATSRTAAGASSARSPRSAGRCPQGDDRRAGAAARARVGADDRGDDAADDASACSRCFAGWSRGRPDAGALTARVVLGFFAAWFAFGVAAHAADELAAMGRRAGPVARDARLGARRRRAGRRRALPVQRAQVPLPRAMPHAVRVRRRALARRGAGARGAGGSASTTACSASAAAGR